MTFWIIVALIIAAVLGAAAISDLRNRRRGITVKISQASVRSVKRRDISRGRAAKRHSLGSGTGAPKNPADDL
jgi:hypothetical protein